LTGKDGDFIRKKSGDLTQKTGISPAKKVGEFTQMWDFPIDFKHSYFFTSIFGTMVSKGMIPRQETQPFSG
jgi:hypothetical protein